MTPLPVHVVKAIRCGPVPVLRDYEAICEDPQTRGEMVIAFAGNHLRNPDGVGVGKKLILDTFQIAFILAVFDNPEQTTEAYLSVARRAGKTFVIAVIMLAFLVGPEALQNSDLASAANSRDQAALVYNFMHKMLQQSPDLAGRWHATPSSKTLVGLSRNVTYRALSADAKTGLGKGFVVLIHDEAGQIRAASSDYVDMLRSSTAGGAELLYIVVSTQARNDMDYLSLQMDAAIRVNDPHAVVHLYTTDPNDDLLDESKWIYANPSLGRSRSIKDLRLQLTTAKEIPTQAGGARNLLLNQRVSQDTLFMAPEVWRRNTGRSKPIADDSRICIGLDLSLRTDLTAAVVAWHDEDGNIALRTHAFAPQEGVAQRAIRDKAPYQLWAEQGLLHLTPGPQVDYGWVCTFLANRYPEVYTVEFDRWRIDSFQEAAKTAGFYANVAQWTPVGQGYVSMGVRLDAFEGAALRGQFRTDNHPVLNMAVSQAISVVDDAGNRKLSKAISGSTTNRTSRIDALVAACMAAYPLLDGAVNGGEFAVGMYIA